MTESQKADMTARMAGFGTSYDVNMVADYLLLAKNAILDRCYPFGYPEENAAVPARYETLQCEIAVFLIGKRGAEGERSHSENGVSRSYEGAGIPEALLGRVVPRGAVF